MVLTQMLEDVINFTETPINEANFTEECRKELEQKGVKYVYPLINNKYHKYHIIDWINNQHFRN